MNAEIAVASMQEESANYYEVIEGIILDIDYRLHDSYTAIRLYVKGIDEKYYDVFDYNFKPYFYFVPNIGVEKFNAREISFFDGAKTITPENVELVQKELFGTKTNFIKIYMHNPQEVPKMSSYLSNYGTCYEYDIPFARRYAIDKKIEQFTVYSIKVEKAEELRLLEMEKTSNKEIPELNTLWFDIETYNPLKEPRPSVDPVIMISYIYRSNGSEGEGVITFKDIDLPFIKKVEDERAMLREFIRIINEKGIDIISGYNSANFDIKYLLERAKALKMEFNLSRNEGETKIERHGLVDKVKIGGRVHLDTYLIIKFIAVVGAAEHLLKLNNYTLTNVYEAISDSKKVRIEKKNIFQMWDGNDDDRKELAIYNLNDSHALRKVYETFIPIMIELSKITGNVIGDVAVSTTGQLVEYLLMRYAYSFNEIIPNKPTDAEIRRRLANPIEGAYVKMPDPGLYSNIGVFDFRSLYPSIIISHNIDPSSICKECEDAYVSPLGIKFSKSRKSIMPFILSILIEERKEVKRKYKNDPGNIFLGARSQALKIVANSFYGYLGYARSRWYSRDCAASVTAWGRQYIKEAIENAEEAGFKVLYGDSISGKSKVILKKNGKKFTVYASKAFEKVSESIGSKEYFYPRNLYIQTISNAGKLVYRRVEYIMRHNAHKKVYRVKLKNAYVDVTEDHSLITCKGSLRALRAKRILELDKKDMLIAISKNRVFLGKAKVKEIEYKGKVYDFEVKGKHAFFANNILVHNTDSIFFIIGNKSKEEVLKVLAGINAKLPKGMELELEDIYVRGVFVGKKGSEGGAKKKYAFLSQSGKMKIRGFELVRRDWSKIARETQENVLNAILKEGSIEKAAEIVKEVINRIRSGDIQISDLAINTRLRKGIDSYDAKSPELAAAKKAVEAGLKSKEEVEQSVISYVITKEGNSISSKAVLEEFAKDYDPDYYIEKQVIPAVMRILGELGFNIDSLKDSGKQAKLS
ncbi:MAG: DNA polymerase domain-containing protein [Candidatus Micrarchaeaceae archaeon]